MRRTLESLNPRWNWPGVSSAKLSDDNPEEAERWPTASALFFESGIVLTAALGTCVVVDLLLTILGIPDVY